MTAVKFGTLPIRLFLLTKTRVNYIMVEVFEILAKLSRYGRDKPLG